MGSTNPSRPAWSLTSPGPAWSMRGSRICLARKYKKGMKPMDLLAEEGLAWLKASPFITRISNQIQIVLVGCGGTGSWLAPHIGRFLAVLRERGKQASGLFVDPDVVQPVNIPRQNFCQEEAERRLPKALTLAQRYGAAWGVDIAYSLEPFSRELLHDLYTKLVVVVGCVDNAAGR